MKYNSADHILICILVRRYYEQVAFFRRACIIFENSEKKEKACLEFDKIEKSVFTEENKNV